MTGPFTTITVDEYYRLKDRVRALEGIIDAAEKSLPHGDPIGRMLREAVKPECKK